MSVGKLNVRCGAEVDVLIERHEESILKLFVNAFDNRVYAI